MNKELKQIKDKIYNLWQKDYSGMFSDQDWYNVHEFANSISFISTVKNVDLKAGKYYNYFCENGDLPYRDYELAIHTEFGNLSGLIRCCSAGTIENPFSRYDMIISIGENEDLNESFSAYLEEFKKKIKETQSFQEVIKISKQYAKLGVSMLSILTVLNANLYLTDKQEKDLARALANSGEKQYVDQFGYEIEFEDEEKPEWKLLANNVEATVYNAEKKQCNSDVEHTASMFKLDLKNPEKHKIIAMERTMMKKYGLNYGDLVKIEGTTSRDGIYQIQDTMNRRFAGQNKIDILVNSDSKYGKWNNVKIYKLDNPELFKKDLLKQLN